MFSTLDANSWLWQIEMDERDIDKTFQAHHGLYKYKRMPFGLKSAPQHSKEPWKLSWLP